MADFSIARASDNLFDLIHVPIRIDAKRRTGPESTAALVLSHAAWQKYFDGDPHVVGRTFCVAGQEARIIGIAPANSWHLPGEVDAWLLESPQQLSYLPPESKGFVLADVKASQGNAGANGQWYMTDTKDDGSQTKYDCLSLAKRGRESFLIFLFALTLACLSLPATTVLPLGDYPPNSHSLSWTTTLCRWLFLLAKIVLVLPIIYFASIDAAHLSQSINSVSSEYIQLAISFSASLFALRWTIRDQRSRCPVCMQLLTHPVRVGQLSRTFLAWNGTELICIGGHGLLHVPDIPTSWCSTQRWLYLDPSWNSLFSDA